MDTFTRQNFNKIHRVRWEVFKLQVISHRMTQTLIHKGNKEIEKKFLKVKS